jgi:DNA-binding NarL/FixJ family response regulator
MLTHTAVLVDDQPSTYEAVRALLEDAGFEIVGAARSLTEGRELLHRHQPDLAVLDLEVEGLATVHALHEAAPDCALLLLTHHAEMLEASVLAGALAVVDKRDPHLLEAAVRNLRVRLEQAEPRRG